MFVVKWSACATMEKSTQRWAHLKVEVFFGKAMSLCVLLRYFDTPTELNRFLRSC